MSARDDLIATLADYPNAISHEGADALVQAFRAEVLREAAEALRVEHRRIFWATKPDTCAEAEFLDRMADAEQAGKDTASSGESTQLAEQQIADAVLDNEPTQPEPDPWICRCMGPSPHHKLACGHCAMDVCEDCQTCAACPHTCTDGGDA